MTSKRGKNLLTAQKTREVPAVQDPLYRASDVGLRYVGAGVEALRNIEFELEAGEFLSIIGPSGCGKTTLLKMFGGLIAPTSGRFSYKGVPLTEPPEGVGMAFQDPLLLPWRNVLDNVLLPIEVLRRPKRDYADKAAELLRIVGLAGFEHKSSWQLSGGMRQRVNLCRALIADPVVLLLDEPFGALDAFTREDLWLVLQELHGRTACSVVLITHQLSEAVFLSDRVLVLSRRPGRIVHEERIGIPKPRDAETPLTPRFIEHVGAIRRRIER
jgi:NitT/TauT family transport system ATP-binding protein